MKSILILITVFTFSALVSGQDFEEILKATPDDRGPTDFLGYSVAIDGDYAVVGAYGDDFGSGENRGSAYVYHRVGVNDWVMHQKLIADDQQNYDRFGWSVAIDGDHIVIGAYQEDHDVAGLNQISNAGSAYIFELDGSGNWNQTSKLVASDRGEDDEFGWSVAISGNTAVVGARAEDHNVSGGSYIYSAGSVYIFEKDGSGNWNQTQKICAADRAADIHYPGGYSEEDLGDQFGWAVSISGDYLVVGALHHDYAVVSPPSGALWSSGAAYIFERTGGVWNQVQKIQNFDRETWDRFGCAVDIDTNVIIVGAYSEDEVEDGVSDPLTNPGSAYLFERNISGTWVFTQKIVPDDRNSGDHFGYSFDLKDSLLVVGTHSDDHDEFGSDELPDAGSAYIFKKTGGIWSQYQKIDASDRQTLDEFGISVGLSNNTIIVGAYDHDFDANGLNEMSNAGAAYFFSNETCPILITDQTIELCAGQSLTVGSNNYNASGNYSDLLLSVDGCDSTVNTDLTILPEISTVEDEEICFGWGMWINGNYETTSGMYPQYFLAQNGCDSLHYINLIVLDENTATQNVSICFGETYTIGASTYSSSGIYTDVITASNFCDSVITTNLTVQLPVNTAINQSENVLTAVTSGASYQWINCATMTTIPGATNQTFATFSVGEFAVIVTENGCSDTSSCVHVDVLNLNEISQLPFSIYPNPSDGIYYLVLNKNISENLQIKIFNQNGEVIFESILNESEFTIDLYEFPSGIYTLQILKEQDVQSIKLIKL